jgi:hypothetical protein
MHTTAVPRTGRTRPPTNTTAAIHHKRRSRDSFESETLPSIRLSQRPGYRLRDPLAAGSAHEQAELSAHTSYKCTSQPTRDPRQHPNSGLAVARRREGDRLNVTGFRRLYPLQSQRFHALLNSLFKVLCNFPSRYLFAIGLVAVFSLR